MTSCGWALNAPANMKTYHDQEWGKELHGDKQLFEMLSLELMQAGLSWQTILNKRTAFRADFRDFEPSRIVRLTQPEIAAISEDARIIRNKRKIHAMLKNAQVVNSLEKQGGSFDRLIWAYVDDTPRVNHWQHPEEVPAQTKLSQTISRDLKKMGFEFVGPTIIYSFMQAAGLVNDHLEACSAKYD